MACNCIHSMSEKLKDTNTELSVTIFFNGLPSRLQIATHKKDKKRREKADIFVANFCPICGVKYVEDAPKEPIEGG